MSSYNCSTSRQARRGSVVFAIVMSLVAVDVTPTASTGPSHNSGMTKEVPTQLPAGWSYQHAVGTLPKGGTAAQLLALLGFLVLIMGLLIHWSGDGSCKDERSVFSSSPWRS